MRRPVCHAAGLLVLLAGPILAGSVLAGERPSVDGWPGFAVGKVNIRGGGFCTATLIGQDRALTAAHCLRDPAGRWYPAGRMMVEMAPHRDRRQGHAAVREIRAAPGLRWDPSGAPVDPALDWAVLELGGEGDRDRRVRPVAMASPSERAALGPGSQVVLVAYTAQRPYVATLAEGCTVRELRGRPRMLLHDCAASAAIAGAPVFLETAEGPVLLGIQVGTGSLDRQPVGVAALLEQMIEPEMLRAGGAVP